MRKKKPFRVPSVVISVFVAEPLTNANPALISVGVVALTSLLPAGPMTPRTFEASDWAALTASAVPPGPPRTVSALARRSFPFLWVLLYPLT